MCRTLLRETGHRVLSGPFSTMLLADGLALTSDPKMILGSYEEEVHDVINEIICMAPTRIIDIGASYGYYAVGLATKIANTEIIAFEAEPDPHWQQLSRLANLNGVDRKITQMGFCTVEELGKVCSPSSFILCDCEGGEVDILDPVEVPNLKTCTILIELHEFYRQNLVETLISRFRDSHEIKIIEGSMRDPSRYAALNRFPRKWRSLAVAESRFSPTRPMRIINSLRFMLLTPKD